VPSGEFDTEFGVDDSGMDTPCVSLHLRLVDLVVLACAGTVAHKHYLLDGYYGLGSTVRQ
jgi:hypothetical protein